MPSAPRLLAWAAASGAGLVLSSAVAVYSLSERRMRARFDVPPHALAVPHDAAAVAHGRHVAAARGCAECPGAPTAPPSARPCRSASRAR